MCVYLFVCEMMNQFQAQGFTCMIPSLLPLSYIPILVFVPQLSSPALAVQGHATQLTGSLAVSTGQTGLEVQGSPYLNCNRSKESVGGSDCLAEIPRWTCVK